MYIYAALPVEIQFFPLNYIHFAFDRKISVENMYGTAIFDKKKKKKHAVSIFFHRVYKNINVDLNEKKYTRYR